MVGQILVAILSIFSTQSLLPLVLVSQHFHSLIVRILHFRLLLAASLPEYKLIMEAYHPSRQNVEPYLFCSYLGTDGLSSTHEGVGSLYEGCPGAGGKLAKLGALYSRFRPERPGVAGSMPLRRVAGATYTQPVADQATQPIWANGGDGGSNKILHALNLDSCELFGQFCAYVNLVRLGPRRGVFLSTVDVVQKGQGVMRIWKQWLRDRAGEMIEDDGDAFGADLARSFTNTCPSVDSDRCILWTDCRRNVGLRVGVHDQHRDRQVEGDPDDLPQNYVIEIRGDHSLPSRTT